MALSSLSLQECPVLPAPGPAGCYVHRFSFLSTLGLLFSFLSFVKPGSTHLVMSPLPAPCGVVAAPVFVLVGLNFFIATLIEFTGFNPWVGKMPWRRERLPTPAFWPGEFQKLYHAVSKSRTRLSESHLIEFIEGKKESMYIHSSSSTRKLKCHSISRNIVNRKNKNKFGIRMWVRNR